MSKPPFKKKDDKQPVDQEQKKPAVKDDGKAEDGAEEQEVVDGKDKKPAFGDKSNGDEQDRPDDSGDDEEEKSSIKPKKYTKGSKDGPSSDNSDNNDSKDKTKIDLKPKLDIDNNDGVRLESRADKVLRIAREYRDKTTVHSIQEAKSASYKYQGELVPGVSTMKVEAPSYHKEKHEVHHNGEHIGHVYAHETSAVRKKNSVRMRDGGKRRVRWGYEHKHGGRYSDLSTKKDAVEELLGDHIRHKSRQS